MHIESEVSLLSDFELFYTKRRASIDETIEYAQLHPGDWHANRINSVIDGGRHFVGEISQNPSLQDTLPVLATMLDRGDFDGVSFDMPLIRRRTGGLNLDWPDAGQDVGDAEALLQRRLAMAKLYVCDPELAKTFAMKQIIGLHGT